jgi:hypothetical protein
MGINGSSEAKEHPWFKDFPWKDLMDKKIESPFKPKIGDNFDKKYCEAAEKIGLDTRSRYEHYIMEDSYNHIFRNFTYGDKIEVEKAKTTIVYPTNSSRPSFKKPNGHSKSSLSGLYNNIVPNLKHSNTNKIIKYEKPENPQTYRSSSIKISTNDSDTFRMKKLISSSSTTNILKSARSTLSTANFIVKKKSSIK